LELRTHRITLISWQRCFSGFTGEAAQYDQAKEK